MSPFGELALDASHRLKRRELPTWGRTLRFHGSRLAAKRDLLLHCVFIFSYQNDWPCRRVAGAEAMRSVLAARLELAVMWRALASAGAERSSSGLRSFTEPIEPGVNALGSWRPRRKQREPPAADMPVRSAAEFRDQLGEQFVLP